MHFRYANIDYILLSTLHFSKLLTMMFSYDISCQWMRNFIRRISEYPPELRIDLSGSDVRFAIPKFHLPAHGQSCQTRFSFNFLEGVGRTCGEGIEQTWAGMNAVSMSAREMSPGSRQDLLDQHISAWNFRKNVGLGKHHA